MTTAEKLRSTATVVIPHCGSRLRHLEAVGKPDDAVGGLTANEGLGFLLALPHDYAVMRSDHGVLYMSEVDIGLPFPDYFAMAMRAKIGSAVSQREVMLVGRKIRGDKAVAMGIAESAVEAAVCLAEKLATRKWKSEVYTGIRMSMFPELCQVVRIGKIAAAKL